MTEAAQFILQGQTYLARGDARAALEFFEQAMTLAPDDPDVLRQRAALLTRLQQFAAARRDLDRAVALRSATPLLAALDDFRHALDLAPTADRF